MKINLKIWRQNSYKEKGKFVTYTVNQISEDMSFFEMIDMLMIDKNNNIVYAIEVENSTNFTSGIQRCSNLGYETKKIMVIRPYI